MRGPLAMAGVVGTGGIPVAVSTLAVFPLVQSVLRRVRRTVDSRFGRVRYDAERTIDAVRPTRVAVWRRGSLG